MCFARRRQRGRGNPRLCSSPSHSTGTWSHWLELPEIFRGSKSAPSADQPAAAQLRWGEGGGSMATQNDTFKRPVMLYYNCTRKLILLYRRYNVFYLAVDLL